jgi:tRNA-dihydrouridine synthase A
VGGLAPDQPAAPLFADELEGLSPRENRDVPPLDYDRVYRLKVANPALPIIINGGVNSLEDAEAHLSRVDGVMMGRAAYQQPWRLLSVDPQLFGEPAPFASLKDVAEAFVPYIVRETARGTRLHGITRHMLGLFQAVPGARAFRRHLATEAVKPGAGVDVFAAAVGKVLDADPEMAHIAA